MTAGRDDGAVDKNGRTWWTWRKRGAVAAVLLLVVLGVSAAVNDSIVFVVPLHIPLALAYTFGFRSAPSSALAAVGLVGATAWTSFDAATAEYADERVFYALTNAVLWVLVLLVAAAVGSSIAGRSGRRGYERPHEASS